MRKTFFISILLLSVLSSPFNSTLCGGNENWTLHIIPSVHTMKVGETATFQVVQRMKSSGDRVIRTVQYTATKTGKQTLYQEFMGEVVRATIKVTGSGPKSWGLILRPKSTSIRLGETFNFQLIQIQGKNREKVVRTVPYTAAKVGNHTIYQDYGGKVATATIEVYGVPDEDWTLVMKPASKTMTLGDTETFQLIWKGEGMTDRVVRTVQYTANSPGTHRIVQDFKSRTAYAIVKVREKKRKQNSDKKHSGFGDTGNHEVILSHLADMGYEKFTSGLFGELHNYWLLEIAAENVIEVYNYYLPEEITPGIEKTIRPEKKNYKPPSQIPHRKKLKRNRRNVLLWTILGWVTVIKTAQNMFNIKRPIKYQPHSSGGRQDHTASDDGGTASIDVVRSEKK